jgi:hypothetical protein
MARVKRPTIAERIGLRASTAEIAGDAENALAEAIGDPGAAVQRVDTAMRESTACRAMSAMVVCRTNVPPVPVDARRPLG